MGLPTEAWAVADARRPHAAPSTIAAMPRRATASPRSSAPATLGDRLAAARKARFIGRVAECARFDLMLRGKAEPVWFLHAPGGLGKTTLLAELARRAEATGRIVVEIDARHLAATAEGWHAALRSALATDVGDGAAASAHTAEAPVPPPGSVLLVDTFETLTALETWLRDDELPRYPADVLVVLAGRAPADVQWRLDAGWSAVAAVTRLSPWSETEAHDYLSTRLAGQPVPATLLQQGAGVPLLLALLADAQRHGRGGAVPDPDARAPADAHSAADLREALVRELLARFARELADPTLHAAFDLLTLARSVTVSMLAEVVDTGAAGELFQWLASLPFVQTGPQGLQMHDLVRESFAAAWLARDPLAVAQLAQQVLRHLARRAPLLGRDEGTHHLKDWFFALQHTPSGRFLDHRHVDGYRLGPATGADDLHAAVALVQRRLGPHTAAIARHWLQHAPGSLLVVRGHDDTLRGLLLALELASIDPALMAADPAVARIWAHVQRVRAPRPDGGVWCARLVLDAHDDQLPNPTATLGGFWATQRSLLHPQSEWSVTLHHNEDAVAPAFASATRVNWVHRAPELDHTCDGHHFAAFVRDFVSEPVPPEWKPELAVHNEGTPPPLDRDGFAQAVRDALRHVQRDDQLAASPLRHCRALADADDAPAPVEALRQTLHDAVQALARHPADLKFHHALRLTWLDPGATQERAAAELGLPFNTYRYHLARGAERVAQALWQRELLARRR